MYNQYSSEFATRPVTPVPSLSQSTNTSPTTAGTRSPVTPTLTSYKIQYVTTPITKKQSTPIQSHRKVQPKMSRQPISKASIEKPLPSLPAHSIYEPDASFMDWDSTDDEHSSKRVVQKVKQAFKPRPRPTAQVSNVRPRVVVRNPDNVQNATPRSPSRPQATRIHTSDSITASIRNTTRPAKAPSPPCAISRQKPEMLPTARSRPAPLKILPDKIIPTTGAVTNLPLRNLQNPRASYRHSYDESSAINSTLASLRELADRPRPSCDGRRANPRPSTGRRPPPLPIHQDIDIQAASAFLANEAREFTPPDTPTSATTTSSSAKPKKLHKLFQSLKERTSFRDLRKGSTGTMQPA